MAPVLKTGIPERVSGVRIPPSPPVLFGSRENPTDLYLCPIRKLQVFPGSASPSIFTMRDEVSGRTDARTGLAFFLKRRVRFPHYWL